jgi:hypothetical protein
MVRLPPPLLLLLLLLLSPLLKRQARRGWWRKLPPLSPGSFLIAAGDQRLIRAGSPD